MIDPAYDIHDYTQDAQVAVLEKRLGPNGIGAAVANAKRTQARKQKRRRKHDRAIHHHQQQVRRSERDPAIIVSKNDEACAYARHLFANDPKLLSILLFREIGLTRDQIASITNLSPGTISRAPKQVLQIIEERHHAVIPVR